MKRNNTSLLSKNNLLLLPLAVLIVKIIIIFNIPLHFWLGSDGEHYLDSVNHLLSEGIFSNFEKLHFWPAGYPLCIFVFVKIFGAQNAIGVLVFTQSLYFAFATYFFCSSLRQSQFKRFAFVTCLLISINPTLTLCSLAVGYESIFASSLLVMAGLILRNPNISIAKRKYILALGIGLIASFISFLQPRALGIFAIMILIWLAKVKPKKTAAGIFIMAILSSLILPSTLVARNLKSNGYASISTNLGITMTFGAGPNADGSYNVSNQLICPVSNENKALQDRQLTNCVLRWYASHPGKTLWLSVKKTVNYLSPWSGPLASGTTARNPWLKINPISKFEKTESGKNFLNSAVSLAISWMWAAFGVILFLFGAYFQIFRNKINSNFIAILAGACFSSWAISLLTVGDHRFRLPLLGFSIFLQVVGAYAAVDSLREKFKMKNPLSKNLD